MTMKDVLDDLDFDVDLNEVMEHQCESLHHGADTHGARLHEGPATHLMLGFCVHTTGLRCQKFVSGRHEDRTPFCVICEETAPTGYVPTFIPLPE